MKKLLIILFMFLTVGVFGQNTFKYEIKANGGLSIGGGEKIDSAKVVAGVLVFYRNGDSLIVAPSTGGGGTTMVYPGAGIPLSTGTAWGTSITNNSANWNTAYGWGNHAGLYDATGTASGLISTHQSTYNHTNYNTAYSDRLKWDGGSTGLTAATGRTSLGGTTAGQALFTLTNPSAITFLRVNADNTVTALSATDFRTATATVGTVDTSLMLDPYITDAEARKAINDSSLAWLNGATELSDVAVMLADIKPYYTFGAGTGAAADSTLFAKGNKSFGSFRVIEDSLYVESLTNIYMTSGDSLRFNVYYGNGMTRVATDSLFTAPQGAGSYALQTFTPDNVRTINHDQDVWVGIIGPQPANMRPKEWVLQLNAKIVRD